MRPGHWDGVGEGTWASSTGLWTGSAKPGWAAMWLSLSPVQPPAPCQAETCSSNEPPSHPDSIMGNRGLSPRAALLPAQKNRIYSCIWNWTQQGLEKQHAASLAAAILAQPLSGRSQNQHESSSMGCQPAEIMYVTKSKRPFPNARPS